MSHVSVATVTLEESVKCQRIYVNVARRCHFCVGHITITFVPPPSRKNSIKCFLSSHNISPKWSLIDISRPPRNCSGFYDIKSEPWSRSVNKHGYDSQSKYTFGYSSCVLLFSPRSAITSKNIMIIKSRYTSYYSQTNAMLCQCLPLYTNEPLLVALMSPPPLDWLVTIVTSYLMHKMRWEPLNRKHDAFAYNYIYVYIRSVFSWIE